jgi:hypothetical protein
MSVGHASFEAAWVRIRKDIIGVGQPGGRGVQFAAR